MNDQHSLRQSLLDECGNTALAEELHLSRGILARVLALLQGAVTPEHACLEGLAPGGRIPIVPGRDAW